MGNLDIKFYWAVLLRRLPYFLVVASLLTAVAVTIAFVLPPKYRSQASMLVEPQQIPGDLAESMVPINPFEQVQIIEQRLMTRENLLDLAQRVGLDAAQPELSAGEVVRDVRNGIEFIGFEPDVTKLRGVPGATIIGVAFEAPTAELAYRGVSELVNLILAENVKLRTGRAGDTLEFFQTEAQRIEGEIARRSQDSRGKRWHVTKRLPVITSLSLTFPSLCRCRRANTAARQCKRCLCELFEMQAKSRAPSGVKRRSWPVKFAQQFVALLAENGKALQFQAFVG